MAMTLERTTVLYKFDILKYLISAIVAWSDVGSDIATCVLYYQDSKYLQFVFCLGFCFAPSIAMTFAYILQHLREDGAMKTLKELFRLGLFAPGMLELRLFTLSIKKRNEVWSRQGYLVTEQNDKNLIRISLVNDYVQSLMEDIPQMILQIHTLHGENSPIHWIQVVSIAISFVSLVSTLASFENRTLPEVQFQNVKTNYLIIITYNAFLLLSRIVAIVAFIISHTWITAGVLGGHLVICTITYYILNRKRFTDSDVWWIAVLILPCYTFVFLGFTVKHIQLRTLELKLSRSMLSAGLYYSLFTSENIMMVTLYFTEPTTRKWYSSGMVSAVIFITLVGVFLNLVFTNLYFREYHHTRHVLSHQAARRSSRYDRNSKVRFSRSVCVHPHPKKQGQEPQGQNTDQVHIQERDEDQAQKPDEIRPR